MKIILSVALVTFLFLQTSTSQETNYQELTQIIIGEEYTDKDVQIIKEEISKSKKKKDILKLPKTKRYLNSKVDIDGVKVSESCAELFTNRKKNKRLFEILEKEIIQLKEKYEKIEASSSQIQELNVKIKNSNAIIGKYNEATDGFKMCLMTQREIRNDYEDTIDDIYKAYTIRKSSLPVANNN